MASPNGASQAQGFSRAEAWTVGGKIVDRTSLYKDALVAIPTPEFIVLYNGMDETPDQWEERLSDAFMETQEDRAKNFLDLTVTVYNINRGRNQELLDRSEHLAGYAEFVAQVREHEKAMPLELEPEQIAGALELPLGTVVRYLKQ
jgi:hypothetical protein